MDSKFLLLGDEAFALGALHAGLSGAYAYPGTPSTEITEFIQMHPLTAERGIHSHWSSNEKTAVEEALGMSFCGKRAIVSMKHVGMNVAADAFINAAMTGANGGLLVAAADDPGMHSSQNEQDSRFYAEFAMVPVLEPSTQQQAYDMARYGFELSERRQIPVMVRFVTRLSHSRGVVETAAEPSPQNPLTYPANPKQWVLMPVNSRVRNRQLIADYEALAEESETSPFNAFTDGPDHSMGIVASGIAYNYLAELFPEGIPFPTVRIGQYPLPRKMIGALADMTNGCLLVLEEGQPLIERSLRGLLNVGLDVRGRLSGDVVRDGELSPDDVRRTLLKLRPELQDTIGLADLIAKPQVVTPRPPALCQGCGHRDVYAALNAALATFADAKVFGDIGCYTLGWLSPFNAIDSCVDMGASITMAKGAADAGQHPAVAIIGDSTFTHSGMTGLLDAINENSNITVIISDNLTTGMTGGQDSQGTGKLEEICLGLGASPEHVITVDSLPRNVDTIKEMMLKEINYNGLSVIVSRRECIQTARRHAAAKSSSNPSK